MPEQPHTQTDPSPDEAEALDRDGRRAEQPQSGEALLDDLRRLVDEEMHLLGQELEDSLAAGDSGRLTQIAGVLDEAVELLVKHRKARPGG
jgi:hypothetical protein